MFGFRKNKQPTTTSEQDINTSAPVAAEKPVESAELADRLIKTRRGFGDSMADFFLGKKSLDSEMLDELETSLLGADVGIQVCDEIIESLQQQLSRKALTNPQALRTALSDVMTDILKPCEVPLDIGEYRKTHDKPFVVLVVGINGAGKTTSIGKLAHHFKQQGLSVLMAAGDTFRAAAVEQLQAWGARNQVSVVAQGAGADSASVIFDAVQSATAKNIDVVIADTAGRLHTQSNLMDELEKIKRVLTRLDASAPQEILLVLDAGFGQNALHQAEQFHRTLGLTGLAITKLDGTAKGGIVFAIARKLGLPIRFIGVGESIGDLRPFVANDFVDALLSTDNE
jgi:fused signal recognition particle receptor